MRSNLIFALGIVFLSSALHAEHQPLPGSTGNPADIAKNPAVGLLGKKVSAKPGEKEFVLPAAATQRLDNWYKEHKDSLNAKAWNNPEVVTDKMVKDIKRSLGSYLLADDVTKFSESVRIGITPTGAIKVEFPKSGQSFHYTPGPADKYK